jgi:RNA polymerase sigma factor (sigma-70 family)
MTAAIAFVLFGDVVRSRDDSSGSTTWLRALTAELERAYPRADRLAPFAFTQGDELQGLLRITADPFEAVLRATLAEAAVPMRWVVAAGPVEPGRGPATQRTGPAFLAARELLEAARARRDRLLVTVGGEPADTLLAELAPLLADLLADLTDRQRAIARLMLVERLRQSEVAERLGVSRATISVMAERARIRRLDGLVAALRRIVADAAAELAGPGDR